MSGGAHTTWNCRCYALSRGFHGGPPGCRRRWRPCRLRLLRISVPDIAIERMRRPLLDRTIGETGARLGVLLFPGAQVYDGDPLGDLRAYGEIVSVLQRLGIPFVDFYEKTKELPWEDLFYSDESERAHFEEHFPLLAEYLENRFRQETRSNSSRATGSRC